MRGHDMIQSNRGLSRRRLPAGLATLLAGLLLVLAALPALAQTDPLPSWNEGPRKAAIIDFVTRVTREGGPDFVPVPERIATFDSDGTLIAEQPMYVPTVFAVDEVKAVAKEHPDWKKVQPFKAVLENDRKRIGEISERQYLVMLTRAHAGRTVAEVEARVNEWIKTARHPRFNRPYTDLVYQPMMELLDYLRANGFKTFVVSGGDITFMRPWMPKAYGIPPEQIFGSSGRVAYHLEGNTPSIVRLDRVDLFTVGPGKPVAISLNIGRRPIFAAGNSDGDLEMLQWTTLNSGPRFALLVHHTDGVREWAYDRTALVGTLDKALDEAPKRGWNVVDMKTDWKVIFPFEKQ